jgi:hypothetical protein
MSKLLLELSEMLGGVIEEVEELPDGSGYAVMTIPLPEGHWIYGDESMEDTYGCESPPMPMRMGTDNPAGMSSVRCSFWRGSMRYEVRL